jgi:L-lactate dehydrogenase (cytochrome)
MGERAVAAAAAKSGTMFGVSSLGTVSLEGCARRTRHRRYQFYFHKDRGCFAMMQRAKEAGVDVMMLTVDSITGETGARPAHGFPSVPADARRNAPPAIKPMWGSTLRHERTSCLSRRARRHERRCHVDRTLLHRDARPVHELERRAEMVRAWNGQFCLKGVMSAADAKRLPRSVAPAS